MKRKLRLTDARGERELLLVGTMCVGRDAGCEISEDDAMLSRRHAEFVETSDGVIIRDLNSLNGIVVNGRKVAEARLTSGDVVEVGHLSLTFIDESGPAGAGAGGHDADRTVVVTPESVPPSAEAVDATLAGREEASSHADAADDRTVVVTPGPAPPRRRADETDPLGRAAPPEGADGSDDRTIVVAPGWTPAAPHPPTPGPAARLPRVEVAAPEPGAPMDATAGPRPAVEMEPPKQTGAAQTRTARVARTSWATRIVIQLLALTVLVLAATALPMQLYQNRLLENVAEERAAAMVRWLAADASAALTTQTDVSRAADEVGMQPGVNAALVLAPDGRVLAPGSRAAQPVEMIPGIGPPDDVHRAQRAWNGEWLEIVQPVPVGDEPRAAVAWLTFRPSALPAIGGSFVVLGPAILLALVGGLVAAATILRTTLRALTVLNEDVELAMAGQLTQIEDPLGAKPVKDLATNVNYLITRIRTGSSGTAAVGGPTARPPSAPAAREDVVPVGRLVTDGMFRITDASPECERVLGTPIAGLIGQHVIDAIQDKRITDALLRCLGEVAEGGETRVMIEPTDQMSGLALMLERQEKNGPLTITLTAMSPGDS